MEGRIFRGKSCEYIKLKDVDSVTGCEDGMKHYSVETKLPKDFDVGTKFVIKQEKGTRKQFLILNGEAVLAFVKNGDKFADCDSYTEVTTNIQCKTVDGLNTVDLEKAPGNYVT